MPANLGPDNVLFRVGSGTPSKVFLGSVAIQNVPGQPVITSAAEGDDIFFTPPADDGGLPIVGYNYYINDERKIFNPDVPQVTIAVGILSPLLTAAPGDDLQIAAVNAIGEGPLSEPFVVTEV